MKVLLIDVNFKYSSTGKIVYDLYTYLKNKSYDAGVCYGRGPLIRDDNIYKFSINSETYSHALLTRITGLTGIYSPISTQRLLKFIKEFNPDVVHIHELHGYFVNIAPLINYLKKNNIKTVWTFHCEFMYTGKCGHANDCDKWKTGCENCPQVRDYPASWYFDFTRKMFNDKKKMLSDFENLIIVTPSKWLANRVQQSFLKDKEIQIIYNGIDTEKVFYPRKFKHLKEKHKITDEKIILAVGSNLMTEAKGGKWVLKLAKKFKNEKVKFILIGIEDLTQKFDENIIALGNTTNQIELAEYYSMADLTILTSEKETFSLVCAESLACGTPILGFESGAPSEIAPNGYGLFVKYGDIESLEKKLYSFLKEKIKMKTKNECVNFASENYSKLEMGRKYINIYLK